MTQLKSKKSNKTKKSKSKRETPKEFPGLVYLYLDDLGFPVATFDLKDWIYCPDKRVASYSISEEGILRVYTELDSDLPKF